MPVTVTPPQPRCPPRQVPISRVSNLAGECSWKIALEIYSFGHRL
jgi:hypothetical protein